MHRYKKHLLIFVAISIIPISSVSIWTGQKSRSIETRNLLARELLQLGFVTRYDHQGVVLEGIEFEGDTCPDAPKWLRTLFGDDFFQEIDGVKIETCDMKDVMKALPLLKKLPNLKYIILPSCGGSFDNTDKPIDTLLRRNFPNLEFFEMGVIG